MKRIALFLAAAALVVSCKNLAENEFEITGKVDASFEGKKVFLEKQGGAMGFTAIDTAVVKDGEFTFKDTTKAPAIHFISIEGKPEKLNFILEPGAIDIKVDKDTIYKSTTGGTYNNDKLEEFKQISYKMYKKSDKFQKANTAKYEAAAKINDTVTINKLSKERLAITKEWEGQLVDFIKKNPKAYCDVIVLGQIAQMGVKKIEEVKVLFDSLDPAVKNTKEGKQISDYFKKLEEDKKTAAAVQQEPEGAVKVGDIAPDFSAPSPDGKQLSLKQSLGKVTIVDFWASWCKPCRAENPNVVALYNELHAEGLNIIGVSLDKEAGKWKEAIAADKLTWNQISNLKFWEDPIAKQYGVTGIPATFILDASGKIVARDLRGAELKAKVNELLASK